MSNEEIQSDFEQYGAEEVIASYISDPDAGDILTQYINELEDALRQSAEAMRRNLVYGCFKDEKPLYDAYMRTKELLKL